MAYVYDKLMMHAPYNEWVDFTQAAIKKSGKKIEQIADFGCGTGEITTRLAKAGYSMTGVDYSAEMLTYAEHKASKDKLSIQWICQDLRELEGLIHFDAVVSYCDVMNYITTEEELKLVFKRAADSLNDGGLFIFDVHSLSHVDHHYINQTFADVMDDASYIWFCSGGDVPGEMYHDLTFFSLDGKIYERFDEYHYQRTYSVAFYKKLLIATGFENVDVYADFELIDGNLDNNSERIFFLAEKRLV